MNFKLLNLSFSFVLGSLLLVGCGSGGAQLVNSSAGSTQLEAQVDLYGSWALISVNGDSIDEPAFMELLSPSDSIRAEDCADASALVMDSEFRVWPATSDAGTSICFVDIVAGSNQHLVDSVAVQGAYAQIDSDSGVLKISPRDRPDFFLEFVQQ